MALKIFKSARAALEVTRGTDLTPTRLLYFEEGEHQQEVATIRPKTLGSYFGWRSGASAGTEINTLSFSDVATYQDMIWWLNTHVKAVASGTASTGTITSSSVASPSVITTPAAHTLVTGDSTTIAGHTGSTPSINGTHVVTVLTSTTFTIPVNVTVGGTGGTFTKQDKTWTFVPSGTTDDIKSATIQIGYSDGIGATQPAVKLNYCLGDELTVTWQKSDDGAVRLSSKMVVPKAATQISAFTGSLTDRTVIPASANTTVVTIDGTTIGTTVDNYWTDVAWTVNNGYKNLYTLNNTTAAIDTFRPDARAWKLEGTRYYNSDTEWDAYVAKTVRKVRIKTTGAVLGGSFYSIQLDLYGVYTAMQFAEADGLGMQKFTLEPVYDTTATTDFSWIVVNDIASIT